MADCIDGDQATRAAQARRALQRSLARLRAAGIAFKLTQTTDSAYERIALTYTQPGQNQRVIADGWLTGEEDNEAQAFTYVTLEVLKLLGADETR